MTSQVHTPPSWVTDQDILARLVKDMGVWCGFTGEERNAKLTYLALTSRILDDPVSIAVKGLSSSGKSYTVVSVLRFFPDEAYIAMTAMSERALIYMKDDFAHKTLVLYEAVALREEREKSESNLTAYIVRSLLSEGEIRYPVAVRGDDGKMVTETITKEGPTNFICTTTATSLHGENETRMLSLPTDDSEEQTSAIMASIAAGRARRRLRRVARLRPLDRRANKRSSFPTPVARARTSRRSRSGCAVTSGHCCALSSPTRSCISSTARPTSAAGSSPPRPITSPCAPWSRTWSLRQSARPSRVDARDGGGRPEAGGRRHSVRA